MRLSRFGHALCLVTLFGFTSCERKTPPVAKAEPQKVKFAIPVEQTVLETEDFPGRTIPVETVELRSRVTGYLEQIEFDDGAQVSAGDLLFVLDSRTFAAEETRTRAAIDQFQARVSRLESQLKRSKELLEKQAISVNEYETIMYDLNEAQASLQGATATYDIAKLNAQFTRITAPISGRIGRRLVDEGNLVTANTTLLATLIPTERMHVQFDMDERTVLRLRRLLQEKRTSGEPVPAITVEIALADSDRFDLRGTIDFEENHLDASTGTLRIRALVDNSHGLLSPGLFVRVRYPVGEPAPALLIPEEALGSDQGRPFVYVIGDDNHVAYRAVQVGPLVGGNRVIRSGLNQTERVVVTGLQRIRRDTLVAPEPNSKDAGADESAKTVQLEKEAPPANSPAAGATPDDGPDDKPSTPKPASPMTSTARAE